MDEKQMIEELVKMLDSGMADGVGHINVECDDQKSSSEVPGRLWPAASPLCTRDWTILNNDH